ncbi:MAG: helix-turn-helix transcriptional regulator [Bacteroidales bacterium]|jgi:AraC-like DNA-binding protein|nr:helix-turn-helix transcriptional regulator [Bacteroidales bacterium]
MGISEKLITRTFYIKNMVSNCCIILLKEKFEYSGIRVDNIQLGTITVTCSPALITDKFIDNLLGKYGFELIKNRELQLIEQIKIAIIELIHQLNNVDSIVRKSDYLVEKLGLSYSYLSRIFSSHEPITLERYIILQKMERIKELIDQSEYTLSEIAFMMDYCSVQYLSNQFRKETGLSVTDYKKSNFVLKKPIDKLY